MWLGMVVAVNRNEGLRSMLRGKLNRLARRMKGYIKSVDIPVNPLALVLCNMFKLNAIEKWVSQQARGFDTLI